MTQPTQTPLMSGIPDIPQMTAPAFLRLGQLTDVEETSRVRLLGQLSRVRRVNVRQEAYYEGAKRVRDLGIAIPPHLTDVEAVAAWPEIVVDVLDERMDWQGWVVDNALVTAGSTDPYDLSSMFAQNHLDVEVSQAVLDSLIFGIGFLVTGTGRDGEPDVLVTAESPQRITGTWDRRLRRCSEALAETFDPYGRPSGWVQYLPDETVTISRVRGGVTVVDRDEHGKGRVPVSMLRNRARTDRDVGRSEITRAVRSLTDSGMRTLLGAEVAREFYGAPQRWLMGADESMFEDSQGNKISQWDAVIGRMLMAPKNEDGELPTVGTFASASPQPFTELLKTYSQMVSAATGVPANHLGFASDNPSSADSIRLANDRLDTRSIRRAKQDDLGLIDVAEVALLWRDGEAPPAGSIGSHWRDPSTPTPAAAADRAQKLIAAGVFPPDSDVTYEELGLSPQQIQRLKADKRRTAGRDVLATIRQAAGAGLDAGAASADSPGAA